MASTEIILPPLFPVTPNDHGGWVIAVSTIVLILSVLSTSITIFSRIRVLHKLAWSDLALFIGCAFLFPQTVCINWASSHGLGRHQDALTPASIETYSKALYASQLLSVLVLAGSKVSVTLLVLGLKPFKIIAQACYVVLVMTAAWIIASLVGLGAQCDQPTPWNSSSGRCVDQQSLYVALGVVHILLDIAVIVLPVMLLSKVQIIQRKRHHISALFAIRILVVGLTIAYLVSLQPYFNSTPLDQAWHGLMPVIWMQLVESSSILCTCIPMLKRVLSDLQTGMMAGAVSDGLQYSVSEEQYGSNSGSRVGQRSVSALQSRSRNSYVAAYRGGRPEIERVDSQKNLRDHAAVQNTDDEGRYERGHNARAPSGPDSFLSD